MRKTLRQWKRALSVFMAAVTVFTSLSLDTLVVRAADGEPDPNPDPTPTTYVAGTDISVESVLGEAANYGIVANDITFVGDYETNFATKLLHANHHGKSPRSDGFVGNTIIAEYASDSTYAVGDYVYEKNNQSATGEGYVYTTKDNQAIMVRGGIGLNTTYTKEQLSSYVGDMITNVASKSRDLMNEGNQIHFNDIYSNGYIDIASNTTKAGTYYIAFSEGDLATFMSSSNPTIKLVEGQKIVLNIPDEVVSFTTPVTLYIGNNNYYSNAYQAEMADKVVYNCPDAKTVTFNASEDGIFIAPNASATLGVNAVSAGWIVADKFKNGPEWHMNNRLNPHTPNVPGTPNEEPKPKYVDITLSKKSSVNNVDATGAKFALYKDQECTEANKIAEVETKLGSMTFMEIEYDAENGSTFYLKETVALPGHVIDNNTYKVVVDKNGTYKLTDLQGHEIEDKTLVNKPDNGEVVIKLTKKDAKTNEFINGVDFTIYSDEACTTALGTKTSTGDGLVTFDTLPYSKVEGATYYIKETSVPTGYVDNTSTVMTVKVYTNGTYEIKTGDTVLTDNVVTNTQLAPGACDINFKKVDADNGNAALGGAQFTLYSDADCQTAVGTPVTSGADGLVSFTGLSYSKKDGATYYVKETAVPTGYKDSNPVVIKVLITNEGAFTFDGYTKDGDYYLVKNYRPEPGTTTIEFTKVDSITNSPIKGAKFQLVTAGGNGPVVEADENGKVTFRNVSHSTYTDTTYTIKETVAPAGYVKTNNEISVTIDKDGKVSFSGFDVAELATGTVVKNTPVTTTVKLSKQALGLDGKGSELDGAKMQLYVPEGSNGSLAVAKRESGPVISETTVNNKKAINWTSDGKSPLELSGLTDGKYMMKEISAPNGYEVATTVEFTVENSVVGNVGQVTAEVISGGCALEDGNVVVMIDDAIPVTDVVISKKALDVAGDELAGASMTLTSEVDNAFELVPVSNKYAISNDKKTITWTSTTESLEIKGLKDGSYTLHEEAAPSGYLVATDITFTVSGGKISADKTVMDAKLVGVKDSKNFVIMVDDAVPTTTVEISKEALKVGGPEIPNAYLELTPVDVENVKFDLVEVTGASSKSDTKITWTSTGKPFVIEGLRDGSYTLHETKAPRGYELATDITFTVSDGKISADKTVMDAKLVGVKDSKNYVIMVDDAKTTTVSFSKQALGEGEAYNELSGATIKLYPASDENKGMASVEGIAVVSGSKVEVEKGVATWISGDVPTVISGLTDGRYVMEETAAPKGYTVVSAIIFDIKDGVVSPVECTSGKIDESQNYIVMFNAAVPVTNVTLSKEAFNLPEGGKELAGASMKLTSGVTNAFELVPVSEDNKYVISDDKKTISWTSTTEALTLSGIKDGTYTMHEEVAPSGYLVATDIVFTVEGGEVKSVSQVTAEVKSGDCELRDNNMVVMIDDAVPATVTISKQDLNVAGKELPGASLTLTADSSNVKKFADVTVTGGSNAVKNDTNDVITWTSAENSPLVINNIPDGKYVMHESSAPDGYEVATDISFEIIKGVAYVTGTSEKLVNATGENFVVMKDKAIPETPKTSVVFSKQSMVEGKGGQELPGATIYVFPYNLVSNTASVEDAKAECDDKNVKVTKEKNVTLKYDVNTSKTVPVAIKWTSGNASVKLDNLPDGTYVMHEEVAPNGFLVATDIIFNITDGKAVVSEINENVNGIVSSNNGNKIIMMDQPRQPMIPIKPATPSATIEISKKALNVAGDEIEGAQITLSVDSSVADNTGSLKNAYAKSGAFITKDGDVVSWTSTKEPLVLLAIPDGAYVLHEVVAPEGYELATDIKFTVKNGRVSANADDVKTGLVSSDNGKNIVIMVDDLKVVPKADITISKKALEVAGDEIEGASIVLTEKDNAEIFEGVTSDKGGKDVDIQKNKISWTSTKTPLELKGLEDGTYVMHELAAPSGYEVATDITFQIKDGKLVGILDSESKLVENSENADLANSMIIMVDDATPEVPVVPVTSTVSISKKGLDVAGPEITGAKITVTAVGGTASFTDVTVDSKSGGKDVTVTDSTVTWISTDKPVVLTGVPDGTYVMHEEAAPSGYVVATDITFTIEDGVATPVDSSSELVYNKDDKNFVIMVDDAKTTTVTFSKKALEVAGDEIPGAKITVTPESTTVKEFAKEDIKVSEKSGGKDIVITDDVITWESTDKPVVLSGLPDGTYVMHEEAAPSGYVVATDIKFTIVDGVVSAKPEDMTSGLVEVRDSENFVIMVDDAIPTTSVTFSKKALNIAGDEIPGASIVVYADINTKENAASIEKAQPTNGRLVEVKDYTLEDGTVVKAVAWTSTTESLELKGLPDGTYIMHEDAAPSGFLVATDIKFTIKDGKVSANADDMKSGLVKVDETDGKNYVIMVDDAKTTTVAFSKEELNVAGTELIGAELSVYPDKSLEGNTATIKLAVRESGPEMIKSDDEEIITWTSGSAPLVLSGLTEGRYIMHEVAAPTGYAVATDIVFDIVDGKAVAVSCKSGSVSDTPDNLVLMIDAAIPTTTVSFSKKAMNVNGDEIDGALIYVLVDPTVANNTASIKYATGVAGPSVEKINAEVTNITDGIEIPVVAWESGKAPVVLAGLPDGHYIMHEEAAPSGYLVATDIRFEIKDGKAEPIETSSAVIVSEPNNMVTMIDDATTKVVFDKIQKGNVDISVVGAELSITSADGSIDLTNVFVTNGTINKSADNKVITWTSAGVALEFWGLPNGDYILTETSAPKDYKVTDPIKFNASNGVITYIGDIREDGSVVSSENGNKILMADLYDPTPKNPKPKTPPTTPPQTPPTPPQTPPTPPTPGEPPVPEEPNTPPVTPPTTVTPPESITPPPTTPNVPVVKTPPKKKPANKATVTINDNKTPMASDVSKAGDVNTGNLTGDEFAHDGFLYAILSALAAISLVGAALLAKKKED